MVLSLVHLVGEVVQLAALVFRAKGIPAARVPSYVAGVRGENEDATLADNKDTRPTIVLRVRGISQLSSHLPFPYSSSHYLVLVSKQAMVELSTIREM